jgi:hypothetical protein
MVFIPGVSDYKPLQQESGDTGQLSFEEHCAMAAREAAKQSSPRKVTDNELLTINLASNQ